MKPLIEQGILGIVTGIVTTAILFTLKVLWSNKVTPFLVGIRYQGVKIDGQWSGLSEVTPQDLASPESEGEPFRSECNLFLTQNAHTLGGSFLFKFKNEQKDFSLDFDVSGYMWEGYVTLNFTPRDKRVTSYATGLFKLHDGGVSLIGVLLFRDVEKEFVNQIPLMLFRNQK